MLYAALDQCRVAMAAAHDPRPVLEAIHVKATAEAVTFAATDGHALVTVRVAAQEHAGDWEGLIDRESVKPALDTLNSAIKADRKARSADTRPSMATLTMTDERPPGAYYDYDGTFELACGLQTIKLARRCGSFPHYDQLIPPHDQMTGSHAAFNGAMLGDILKIAGKYAAPQGYVRVYMPATPSQPCRLDWQPENDEWAATAVVMPLFATW